MNFKTKKDKKIYIIILSIGLLIFSSGYLYLKMNLLKNEFEIFVGLLNILSIIFIPFVVYMYYNLYVSFFKNYNTGQYGTAKWEKSENLQNQYKSIPQYGNFEGKGGIVIAWDEKKENMFVDSSATNTELIAISRGGKGELVIIPSIDNLSRGSVKPSMIIFDKKPELYNLMGENLQKEGYDVKVLNLKTPNKSMGFNPLDLVIKYYLSGDTSQAELELMSVAESLIKSEKNGKTIWVTTARTLFRSGVFALIEEYEEKNFKLEDITLYSVYHFISNLASVKKKEMTGLNVYFDEKKIGVTSKKIFNSINLPAGNTWSSVMMSTLPILEIFSIDSISKLTAINTIDFLEYGYGDKPIALFITFPTKNEIIEEIASVYIDQMYSHLDEETEKKKGKLDREIYFIFDEIASIKRISTIGKILSTGLGKGFRSLIVLQSKKQLRKEYSEAETDEILENCSNKIFILSDKLELLKEISEGLGTKTIEEKNSSGMLGKSKNFNTSFRKQPLITVEELEKLEEAETIVKRINYRRNHLNESIKPLPIFNSGDNKMKYRHEYLDLKYKHIDEMENLKDNLEEINLAGILKKINVLVLKIKEKMNNISNEKLIEEEFEEGNELKKKIIELNEKLIEEKILEEKVSKENFKESLINVIKEINFKVESNPILSKNEKIIEFKLLLQKIGN